MDPDCVIVEGDEHLRTATAGAFGDFGAWGDTAEGEDPCFPFFPPLAEVPWGNTAPDDDNFRLALFEEVCAAGTVEGGVSGGLLASGAPGNDGASDELAEANISIEGAEEADIPGGGGSQGGGGIEQAERVNERSETLSENLLRVMSIDGDRPLNARGEWRAGSAER